VTARSSRPLVALCYGTRPQIIKASVLRRALQETASVRAVDTGQHYDFALNGLLYQQLGVDPPDHYLEVGSGSHAEQTAAVLIRVEALARELQPDAVVVIGDTNSTLGCALAAAKLRIPVAHVEAGLRAADRMMPEEVNRRVTDAVAGLLCAPSEAATRRLRQERPDAMVIQTGDIARDVMMAQVAKLPPPGSAPASRGPSYVFATLHRAELTARPEVLRAVLATLAALPVPTVFAMHPRTRAALDAAGIAIPASGSLRVSAAVGYLESLTLIRDAAAVITDSGGVQREAYWFGVPCVTLRTETEWVETVELGANQLLAPARVADHLPALIGELTDSPPQPWDRDAYGTGQAAQRVATALANWLA
jgi:UDP-N-acetylglucosamine 2-epimerase